MDAGFFAAVGGAGRPAVRRIPASSGTSRAGEDLVIAVAASSVIASMAVPLGVGAAPLRPPGELEFTAWVADRAAGDLAEARGRVQDAVRQPVEALARVERVLVHFVALLATVRSLYVKSPATDAYLSHVSAVSVASDRNWAIVRDQLCSPVRPAPLARLVSTRMAIRSAPIPAAEPVREHGEVFTRRWVVELILDLVGYTADRDLIRMKAIEPACGTGAFLVPMIERLRDSACLYGRDLDDAWDAIQARDLVPANVELSRIAVREVLGSAGVSGDVAEALSTTWIKNGDFLLEPPAERSVDFVVGNPPYVRLEAVARERSDAYRVACKTMGGRADIYIGFYEHGLRALRDNAMLGFICADRWMRNAYGARLRAMVSEVWTMETIISMTGVDAFEDEVDAYPAITILRRRRQGGGPLVIEATPLFDSATASEVVELASGSAADHVHRPAYRGARLGSWFSGPGGWPHGSPDRLAAIADLEARYPALEDVDTGTKVGIGVATGADRVFITEDPNSIEAERLLPLALPRDIASGVVQWSGKYLVNPWNAGGLVSLDDWPRLSKYLSQHRELLAKRHTAQRGRWHKTIDRVTEGLVDSEKLYLPDFKEAIFPVLDEGTTYPHHNLYWVTSDSWDLRVLGGLLLSDVAGLFIEAYSVRMRGGFLRFQAQYLRRIRLPRPEDIEPDVESALAAAFAARDRRRATEIALPLYELSELPD